MMNSEVEQSLAGMKEVEARLPGFALWRLGQIARMVVRIDAETGQASVEIDAHVRDDSGRTVVTVHVVNARGRLPEVGPGCGVTELMVEDLRPNQLEDLRYRVYDEVGDLNLYCRSVALSVRGADMLGG